MGKPSKKLTFEDAKRVWLLKWKGQFNHEIRPAEVLTSKLHPGSRDAAQKMRDTSE